MQLGELVHYALTVGGIGHTKPLALGSEHFDLGGSVIDEFINQRGNEELGLGLIDVFLEELNKIAVGEHKSSISFSDASVFINGTNCKKKKFKLSDGDEVWLLSPASGG